MHASFGPATGLLAQVDLLRVEQRGAVVHLRLMRAAKRNAIDDSLVAQLQTAFVNLPESARAVVLSGDGAHFCAGLDLSALAERSVAEGVLHLRGWHAAFEQIQSGRVPVIAVLQGAVVGGGLELGCKARIPRLIGVARTTGMMLTGRVCDAAEGFGVGLSQYLVDDGAGLEKAFALAEKVAANAPRSNFAVLHALPRIADRGQSEGLFTESLMAAIAGGDPAAKSRARDFLDWRAGKVEKS